VTDSLTGKSVIETTCLNWASFGRCLLCILFASAVGSDFVTMGDGVAKDGAVTNQGPTGPKISNGGISASKFPCPDSEIPRYTAYHTSDPIRVDGMLDEQSWKLAPRSPRFIDVLTGAPTRHATHAAVLWDDTNLYVAYEIEEPLVHAKFTQHNDPIYMDNDVEFFMAGKDAYYEFEINGFNTCYEVFFIWNEAYESGGFSLAPEFQRNKLQPFNGVGFTHHPKGGRLGNFNWSAVGKQTAVHIDGTVNDDSDRDRGWTVELAFPWKSLAWLAKSENRPLPPKDGDVWRMDFSRFNSYKEAPPAKDSGGWFWSRHGVWDSHIPECFAYVRFSTNQVSRLAPSTKPPFPR